MAGRGARVNRAGRSGAAGVRFICVPGFACVAGFADFAEGNALRDAAFFGALLAAARLRAAVFAGRRAALRLRAVVAEAFFAGFRAVLFFDREEAFRALLFAIRSPSPAVS